MPSWAQKKGIEGTYQELCMKKELKKAILDDMVMLGKESGLHSFEQVKAIYIHCDMFSVQNGLLTPTLKRWLLEFAAKRKQAEVRSGIIRNNSIWDELFFNKIQASLGGHVRMIVTGAAPASPTVLGFLRAALGYQVYEGYGQTECTAGCTFTTPGDWTSGHVGAPLPCNHIKLVDAEELNYWTCKGEGEICVKGPNVFKGYLKDEDRTKEALDSDGWLHTGDIGKWLPEGTLKIIDRKKHIFKLAQGEYVAPEKIENIYIRSEPVAQIYVHEDQSLNEILFTENTLVVVLQRR